MHIGLVDQHVWVLKLLLEKMYMYIYCYLFVKCRDLKGNRKNRGYTASLPSASYRRRPLPSACSWQSGHVAPSCAIWQQLGDHLVIMPSASGKADGKVGRFSFCQ